MIKPVALCFIENASLSHQLNHQLEKLGYDAIISSDDAPLIPKTLSARPLVILVDLNFTRSDMCQFISDLRKHPDLQHIPVMGFLRNPNPALEASARAAGTNLIALETGLVQQLPELLEQTLVLD